MNIWANLILHLRRLLVAVAMIVGLVSLDQASKFWVKTNLSVGETIPVWRSVVHLTYLQNRGAAFSILQNQQGLFALITILVVGVAFYFLLRCLTKPWWWLLGLIFIIAGGIGNFIDRLSQGYVVDMIDFRGIHFAVFNIADSCLTVGVILMFISIWKEESGSHN